MTLFNLITLINKKFPGTDKNDICSIANEIENRVVNEIFSPCGIDSQHHKLTSSNINANLILPEEYISLYTYFIYAILSLRELDFEGYNSYSILFNEKFKELAVFYRRNNIPVKNTIIKGGV